MKRAGEVVRVAQGLAIVRCPDEAHPDIGTELSDQELSTVGRVVDVFGPVERPYLAVDPRNEPTLLLGSRLYAE
ncbi:MULTISPECIES: H/ACA ribonucleoprotein complex subunit GAR1 [Halococcus]|uniref:H/ACA RNA-protein complex component Gar1 n=1 Tax=Halococcus salifodinae DSM 8989 TaxID=1227456 RepID=M0N459_9EURY|nr:MULTISPECIES: Gar1/Naf1 family protein [Halococcus]EMA52651.1 H/ACA RNA-protein complex component Gar1 [Halococcus salifodinae DSM 8989]